MRAAAERRAPAELDAGGAGLERRPDVRPRPVDADRLLVRDHRPDRRGDRLVVHVVRELSGLDTIAHAPKCERVSAAVRPWTSRRRGRAGSRPRACRGTPSSRGATGSSAPTAPSSAGWRRPSRTTEAPERVRDLRENCGAELRRIARMRAARARRAHVAPTREEATGTTSRSASPPQWQFSIMIARPEAFIRFAPQVEVALRVEAVELHRVEAKLDDRGDVALVAPAPSRRGLLNVAQWSTDAVVEVPARRRHWPRGSSVDEVGEAVGDDDRQPRLSPSSTMPAHTKFLTPSCRRARRAVAEVAERVQRCPLPSGSGVSSRRVHDALDELLVDAVAVEVDAIQPMGGVSGSQSRSPASSRLSSASMAAGQR